MCVKGRNLLKNRLDLESQKVVSGWTCKIAYCEELNQVEKKLPSPGNSATLCEIELIYLFKLHILTHIVVR